MGKLTLVMAQLNPLVGDIDGNTRRAIEAVEQARREYGAEVVVFPELMLTGYPPEDLLLRPSIAGRIRRALDKLCAAVDEQMTVVIGYPKATAQGLLNVAGVLHAGRVVGEYAKRHLPNYRVFDEKRYFVPGGEPLIVDIGGIPTALTVCEDIWQSDTEAAEVEARAGLMLNLNASPYRRGKAGDRLAVVRERIRSSAVPVVYVNMVGGQDELVFDGGSMAVSGAGELLACAPRFEESLFPLRIDFNGERVSIDPVDGTVAPPAPPNDLAEVYQALVLGVRDYVNKNGFKGVVLGLSGGIDSALTLAIAVDALGKERVEAVMMPFRYTSQMSIDDAAEKARNLGVAYHRISIEPIYESFMQALDETFAGAAVDKTEENIQARSRGVLLMAISNKKGYLVLTTGNKSEMAVGYATLYGDMAGGFDVLKDVSKTLVFALARYRNTLSPVIPQRVIDRPPTAELAPDQKDEDTLPPYDELDRLLELYVERDYSAEALIEEGFERDVVTRVVRLVDLNEYKRRQAAVGPRITQRGFGRDRRYPITSGWQPGD